MIINNIHKKISNIEMACLAGQIKEHFRLSFLGSRLKVDYDLDKEMCSNSAALKNYKSTSWKELYEIEKRLIEKGEYRCAYKVRRDSQQAAIKYFKEGYRISNLFYLIWALVFNGSESDALKLIDDEIKKKHMPLTICKLRILYRIISGDNSKLLDNPLNVFHLPVDMKDITIVGPLYDGNQEIDTEDIITINQVNNRFNGKSTISFYNGEILDDIGMGRRMLPHGCFYVFHREKYGFQRELFREGNASLSINADYVFGLGHPNMLPNILFHLLLFDTRNIYVNGFNLYLSKRVYSKDYLDKSNYDSSINKIKLSFSYHNVITQYQFLHYLYTKGYFIPDETLAHILENGIELYLVGLEHLTTRHSMN